MKKIGIYYICSRFDGAVYIGSSIDLVRRFAVHRWDLRNGKHCNPHLQNAWNKYGEDNFTFHVVESCAAEDLFTREQHYLDQAYSVPGANVYNMSPVAYKPPHSPEAKERQRQRMMGNTHTLGRKRTAAECLATKLGNTGKVRSEEAKANYRRAAQKREAVKRAERQAVPVVAPWIKS